MSHEAKAIRLRAKRSRAWVAAMAGVSEPTATLYELDPQAVKSDEKRASLALVYASLRKERRATGKSPPATTQ